MKKKLFLIFVLTLVIFLTGCGKENKEKIRNNFINDTENLKGYYMEVSRVPFKLWKWEKQGILLRIFLGL